LRSVRDGPERSELATCHVNGWTYTAARPGGNLVEDERDDIGGDEDVEGYFLGFSADAAGDGRAAACLDFGRTGNVRLLITARPCETCGRTGRADAGRGAPNDPSEDPDEPVQGYWYSETAFDDRDRVVRQREWFVPCPGGPDTYPAR